MALNKVMLIGNVGADPEVRYLEGNTKVASLRLATTERYTSRSGEAKEQTEWHSITAWRQLADLSEKYIKKGSQIYVEGRLRTREYTDQSGAKRYRTEIQADSIQLLGRRESAGQDGAYQGGQSAAPARQQQSYQRPAYQAPAQPAYQAPVQTAAPAPAEPIDLGNGDNPDDLPF